MQTPEDRAEDRARVRIDRRLDELEQIDAEAARLVRLALVHQLDFESSARLCGLSERRARRRFERGVAWLLGTFLSPGPR